MLGQRELAADADRVVLASGAELFPDYLVLATGSGYPFPAKPDLPGAGAAHGKVRSTLVDVAGDVLGERYGPDLKAELRRQLTLGLST